jgi:DNA-binding CsgD family transcriptional regulator
MKYRNIAITAREQEVLVLLAKNHTAQELADVINQH